ncbi:MAG TPA: cupin domain-containing protein [Steroidobacteraceae bacterium]|jgi:hypothetical protein|nr:cupin domain-containing protein [Steroidobacteraceae bacterium]
MVIAPGEAEGDHCNRHQGADQWLYVVSGAGRALVNGRRVPLSAGVMLLIERRDRHEIRNTGRTALKTLNYYSPPAYTRAGGELAAARRTYMPCAWRECVRDAQESIGTVSMSSSARLPKIHSLHRYPAGRFENSTEGKIFRDE